jgi:hypothetical protein
MTDETKQVMVLLGPYRDNRLTMTAADAESAINNHWAVDPTVLHDPEHEHPPLDDAERQTALDSAHAWAQAQQDVLVEQPPDPPPITDTRSKKAMKPDEGSGYTTREAKS